MTGNTENEPIEGNFDLDRAMALLLATCNLAIGGALVHKSRFGQIGDLLSFLSDALRDWHSELRHPVDRGASDPGFALLRGESSGTQTGTDQSFVTKQGCFDQRSWP